MRVHHLHGRTSMEVCVRTYVEELSGHNRLINVATW